MKQDVTKKGPSYLVDLVYDNETYYNDRFDDDFIEILALDYKFTKIQYESLKHEIESDLNELRFNEFISNYY